MTGFSACMTALAHDVDAFCLEALEMRQAAHGLVL
jgi:hypothetical protein